MSRRVGAFALCITTTVFLSAGSALAGPPPAPMVPDWNGTYFGAVAGLGAANWVGDLTKYPGSTPAIADFPNNTWQGRSIAGHGFLGGAEVGVGMQTNSLVWGLEGDISASGVNGSGIFSTKDFGPYDSGAGGSPANTHYDQQIFEKHIQTNIDWLGTFRARLGVLVTPGTLLYGTGGVAVGGTSSHQDVYFDGSNQPLGINQSGSDSATRWGWTIGGGIEQKITSRWSFKAEYLFANLGSAAYQYHGTYTGFPYGPPGGGPTESDGYSPSMTLSVVRAGFNYKFGG